MSIVPATDVANASNIPSTESKVKIKNTLLSNITSSIHLANDPDESEVVALVLANCAASLIGEYNVAQAKVLADERLDEELQCNGPSLICITRIDDIESRVMLRDYFHQSLDQTMALFYSHGYSLVSFTWASRWTHLYLPFCCGSKTKEFATPKFEVIYNNLILVWARPFDCNNTDNSYCPGIADELHRLKSKARSMKQEQARKLERLEADAITAAARKSANEEWLMPLASLQVHMQPEGRIDMCRYVHESVGQAIDGSQLPPCRASSVFIEKSEVSTSVSTMPPSEAGLRDPAWPSKSEPPNREPSLSEILKAQDTDVTVTNEH